MKALVTGGGGFLGSAIVRRLVARGDTVRTFQRGYYPELDTLGVESIRGDLTDYVAVKKAVCDIDVVFHVAAKAGVWGRYRDYHASNVVGTRNTLEAASGAGVAKFVFTSSPSVVFDGSDENGITEAVSYPGKYLAYYPRTKAEAEKRVLAASSPTFATIALRPHLLWGPGDPHLVPRIVSDRKSVV